MMVKQTFHPSSSKENSKIEQFQLLKYRPIIAGVLTYT